MDRIKYESIKRNRQAIVADLDVIDIAADLFSNKVLTKAEYAEIQGKEKKESCEYLLDRILEKGDEEYDTFRECLKPQYCWLYEAIHKTSIDPKVSEDVYHEMVVLGNFPKLPPNCIERISTVSNYQFFN